MRRALQFVAVVLAFAAVACGASLQPFGIGGLDAPPLVVAHLGIAYAALAMLNFVASERPSLWRTALQTNVALLAGSAAAVWLLRGRIAGGLAIAAGEAALALALGAIAAWTWWT